MANPTMSTWTTNGTTFDIRDKNSESHISNKSNPHGVTAAQAGAAPGGYGLGEGSWKTGGNTRYENAADLDNLKVNGFWAYQKDGAPLEPNTDQTKFVYGITLASGSGFVIQRAVTCYTGVWIERQYVTRSSGNAWTPWKYINPPMSAGIEYRTIEQARGGLTVFRKRVTYTNENAIGSNGTCTEFTIPHEIENFGTVVRVNGMVGSYQPLPYIDTAGRMTAVSHVNATNIVVRTMTGWAANASWSFDIAYTKV